MQVNNKVQIIKSYNEFINDVETKYSADLFCMFQTKKIYQDYKDDIENCLSKRKYAILTSPSSIILSNLSEYSEGSKLYSYVFLSEEGRINFTTLNLSSTEDHEKSYEKILKYYSLYCSTSKYSSIVFMCDNLEDVVNIIKELSTFLKSNPLNHSLYFIDILSYAFNKIDIEKNLVKEKSLSSLMELAVEKIREFNVERNSKNKF